MEFSVGLLNLLIENSKNYAGNSEDKTLYSVKHFAFLNLRSSRQRCPMEKGFLRNFTKFAGKQLCQSLFFNKVAGLRP